MLFDVKDMLDIAPEDTDQDQKLKIIIDTISKRLLPRIGNPDEVPTELEYIVVEMTIVRYNQIGSEGMRQQSMQGLLTTYVDTDFSKYQAEIDAYNRRNDTNVKPRVRFL